MLAAAWAVLARVLQGVSLALSEWSGLGGLARTVALWIAHHRRESSHRRVGGPSRHHHSLGSAAPDVPANVRLPPNGYMLSAAAPPLHTADVGQATAPALLGAVHRGYLLGFWMGTIAMAAFMLLASPAVACYAAGADVCAALYLRPWLRALHSSPHMQPGDEGTVASQAAAWMLEEIGLASPWDAHEATEAQPTGDPPHHEAVLVATPLGAPSQSDK